MRLINKYILKEHVGPFVFALSALTSLLLLQVVARRFGDLVGRGLSWQIITEFFVLSIPFTLALTLPMAVLVAVLYAFSRLAAENEVTALKAGGISTRSLLWPVLAASTVLALFMLWFNDQVLPTANHELATLQMAILHTKPTFALKEQVINPVKEGQLYLRAGVIDRDQSGRIRDVTIYDVADPAHRRTIYADSGTLAFATNKRDLVMHLFSGMMMTSPANAPAQLSRIYYRQDELKVRDVANSFQSIDADTAMKGEREMSICEMQKEYSTRATAVQRAYSDSIDAVWKLQAAKDSAKGKEPKRAPIKKAGGLGALYCTLMTKYLHVAVAEAAEVQQPATRQKAVAASLGQDTSKKKTGARPPVVAAPTNQPPVARTAAEAAAIAGRSESAMSASYELTDAGIRLQDARHWRNRYGVEIQKKFSLAAACIVFVVVGAPIALRFPRGGVGLVIGVSFLVFAVYYIALTGGESLADHGIISPVVAMWGDNALFLALALPLVWRMGREGVTGRGGNFGEMAENARAWFARLRTDRGARRSRGA